MRNLLLPDVRCEAVVYRRDTYRRCGGKRHFALHYARGRCHRRAGETGLCWQHQRLEAGGRAVAREAP